jgi:hypothetical protein
MRFALIDNERAEAKPGLVGFCPGCLQLVVAKCGTQRIHHWAHRSKKACDTWWEPETEWHRMWKNCFPNDWQEVFLPDERTGEKHVGDVRTVHGLVIEFQHSPLDSTERKVRERFYRNMVWVFDGTRRRNDYPRLLKGKVHISPISGGLYRVDFAEECFPKEWLESDVPVLFDFLGTEDQNTADKLKQNLYCLLPERIGRQRVLAVLSRQAFIDSVTGGKFEPWIRHIRDMAAQVGKEWRAQEARRQQIETNLAFEEFTRATRGRTYRGRY